MRNFVKHFSYNAVNILFEMYMTGFGRGKILCRVANVESGVEIDGKDDPSVTFDG